MGPDKSEDYEVLAARLRHTLTVYGVPVDDDLDAAPPPERLFRLLTLLGAMSLRLRMGLHSEVPLSPSDRISILGTSYWDITRREPEDEATETEFAINVVTERVSEALSVLDILREGGNGRGVYDIAATLLAATGLLLASITADEEGEVMMNGDEPMVMTRKSLFLDARERVRSVADLLDDLLVD